MQVPRDNEKRKHTKVRTDASRISYPEEMPTPLDIFQTTAVAPYSMSQW